MVGRCALNGMEISQFTYFQQVGGTAIAGSVTANHIRLERLAMYLQGR